MAIWAQVTVRPGTPVLFAGFSTRAAVRPAITAATLIAGVQASIVLLRLPVSSGDRAATAGTVLPAGRGCAALGVRARVNQRPLC